MRRWSAIGLLGALAVPVATSAGGAMVVIVESWKWRPPGERFLPITMASVTDSWLVGAVLTGAALAWWAGWFWVWTAERKIAGGLSNDRAAPTASVWLALWFITLLALATYWAAATHTFM